MNYTVTLTDTEKSAMEYIAYEPQDWIENVVKERARIAIEEIVKLAVDKFLALNQTIPGSREEIVAAAYTNGWIQTAKYRTDNAETI
jgi:hypothetical protein